MWLLCCGMMRSGSTLQYNIAVRVAQATTFKVNLLGFIEPEQIAETFDRVLKDDDQWNIAKLHDYDPALEAFRQRVNVKAVYVYRDLRDVAVSLMNMFGWQFDSIELDTYVHAALQHDQFWTQFTNISISRYEDVMAAGGLVAEVEKIARYMEVELAPAEIESIADSVNLSAQQRYIEQFDFVGHGQFDTNQKRLDPESLLHEGHIHSGASAQWKTALTSEQIAIVEAWAGEWLEAHGYPVASRTPDEWKQLFQSVVSHHSTLVNALRVRGQSLNVTLAARSHELERCEAAIQQVRARRIVRVMEKLGRPII